MSQISVKKFSSPDEVRPFVDRGHAEVLGFDGGVVGRGVFEPGWRWSSHVKPIAGTASCEAEHLSYVVSGRMRLHMNGGEEAEVGPGDVVHVPPGHDAWTVGDEACVMLDFSGMASYAQPARARTEAEPVSAAPPP
jgi:hypothetical protein